MCKIHDVSAWIMFVVSRLFHVSVTCKIYSNMTRIEEPVVQSSSSPDGMQSAGWRWSTVLLLIGCLHVSSLFFTFLFKTRSSEDRTSVFINSHRLSCLCLESKHWALFLLLINHWWKFPYLLWICDEERLNINHVFTWMRWIYSCWLQSEPVASYHPWSPLPPSVGCKSRQ